jgi:hypothetical protein
VLHDIWHRMMIEMFLEFQLTLSSPLAHTLTSVSDSETKSELNKDTPTNKITYFFKKIKFEPDFIYDFLQVWQCENSDK